MRLRRLGLTLALSVLLASASTVAHAEGPGLRLGDQLVLHLGLGAEIRYDSNVFYLPTNQIGAFIFRLLPSVDLATRPGQRGGSVPHGIDFRLHLGADYNEYLSSQTQSHRSIGALAGLLVSILPGHPFTLDLYDNFARTVQPPYNALPYNLDRDTNEVGVRGRLRPGGGRLEFDLGYTFGIDFFEPVQLQPLNVYYHRINLHAQWAFFPKTAVYIDITETPYVYANSTAAQQLGHPNSFPIRAIAGLSGLITTKLTLNAWIGYGNGLYQTIVGQQTPNANTAIGGLDLRWRPTIMSTAGLGYKHDFVNSLLGSYFDTDAVYVSWLQQLWRFSLSLKLTYQHLAYAGIPTTAGIVPPMVPPPPVPGMPVPLISRNDNNINLDLHVDYPFKDWLVAQLGYALTYNNSDSKLATAPGSGLGLLPLDYLKHEAWLRLSVLY